MEEEKKDVDLKKAAFDALIQAELLMFKYASSLEIGDDRTKAFGCYENIRLAWRNA